MDKGNQTGIAGIGIGIFLTVGTLAWPWPIPDEIRHILFWISAFFVLAGCLWLLDIHFLNKKRKVVRRGIPIFSIVLLVVLIVEVEWPKNLAITGNPLDDQISFSCEPSARPTNYRRDEDLHIYEIVPPDYYGLPASEAGGDSVLPSGDGPINWSGMLAASFLKCTISNYSASAIINATVVIPTSYSFANKAVSGYKNGARRFVFMPPLDIGPVNSPKNSDYFYIENFTKYFVDFSTPTIVEFSLPGSSERQDAKLIPPNGPMMSLFPVFPSTNPPAASPPIPAPQSPQSGK
jgi:hypothetical protein